MSSYESITKIILFCTVTIKHVTITSNDLSLTLCKNDILLPWP